MSEKIERIIAQTFMDVAHALETGESGPKPKIALTGMGSEHGEVVTMEGAVLASSKGVDVYYLGSLKDDRVTCVETKDDDDCHKTMENMVNNKEVDGAVTMHYPFPIGVSTVGRVVTPGKGRAMYVATTTGTSSTDRIEGMIKNAIYGIIAAKACGIKEPTVGIINVDGARQCETALKKLQAGGYNIKFAESNRADGGCVMRGNDILQGTADIMVTDTLTGNLLIKMMSAFTTGGSYEGQGWGYGPGIGEGYDPLVMIVSRASGAQVISGALQYAAELVKGNYREVMKNEFAAAKKAGLDAILAELKAKSAKPAEAKPTVVAPPKEVVTAAIAGIEVMDLDDAVESLWAKGMYAESGMGCTGPMLLVSEANHEKALELLKEAGYIG